MSNGRLPWLRPDELDDQQREFYDAIVGGVRSKVNRPTPLTDDEGRLYGPFNPLLTNPQLGMAVQAVGAGLRFAGTLPRWLFELLVLTVAAERRAQYEWYAHAPIGKAAGLTEEQLDAVREGRRPPLDDEGDQVVLDLASAALRHEDPGEDLVRAVETRYGRSGVTEIVVAIGFYDLLATVMRTWATPLPEGTADPLT